AGDVKTIAPSQPTLLARDVESVLPSRFAGAITMLPKVAPEKKKANSNDNSSAASRDEDDEEEFEPSPEPTPGAGRGKKPTMISPAPVVSFANDHGSLLIDYPHGKGRIVLLADPYIVANNGINRADNL